MKAIEKKKLEIIKHVSNTTNLKLVEKVHKICEKDDWWFDLPDAAKKSIERGLEDIKKGRTKPHSEVKKMYSKWLRK